MREELWLWLRAWWVDQGVGGLVGEMGLAREGRRKSSRVAAGQGGALVRGEVPEMAWPQVRYR
jgi:hypothetical protein